MNATQDHQRSEAFRARRAGQLPALGCPGTVGDDPAKASAESGCSTTMLVIVGGLGLLVGGFVGANVGSMVGAGLVAKRR